MLFKTKNQTNQALQFLGFFLLGALVATLILGSTFQANRPQTDLGGKLEVKRIPMVFIENPTQNEVISDWTTVRYNFKNVEPIVFYKAELYKDGKLFLTDVITDPSYDPLEFWWDTRLETTNKPHSLFIKAYTRDTFYVSRPVSVTIGNPSPTIVIVTPANNTFPSGKEVPVVAQINDVQKIKAVKFTLPPYAETIVDEQYPFIAMWDTTQLTDKDYSFNVIGIDQDGNEFPTEYTTVHVSNEKVDKEVPKVKFIYPTAEDTVIPGVPTEIKVEAVDNLRLNHIVFKTDAVKDCVVYYANSSIPDPSYMCPWTPSVFDANGEYIVQAWAYDDRGNYTQAVVEVKAKQK